MNQKPDHDAIAESVCGKSWLVCNSDEREAIHDAIVDWWDNEIKTNEGTELPVYFDASRYCSGRYRFFKIVKASRCFVSLQEYESRGAYSGEWEPGFGYSCTHYYPCWDRPIEKVIKRHKSFLHRFYIFDELNAPTSEPYRN